MAIAFEDSATGENARFATSLVLTPAGGAAASGELVLIGVNWVSNSTSLPSSYTLSGFTQVDKLTEAGNVGELVVFRKFAAGGEASSYTLTWTGGDPYRATGGLIVLSGIHATTPVGTPVKAEDATASTTWSIPALTTTTANSWDVAFVSGDGNVDQSVGGTSVLFSAWGSSLIERCDIAHDFASTGIATALRASAGVQAATTVTVGLTSQNLAIRLEVFEAGVAPTGQPTFKRGRGVPGMRLGGTTFGQGF